MATDREPATAAAAPPSFPRPSPVGRPWHVAIVPDSFKGSASAVQVARAIEEGVTAAAHARGVSLRVSTIPFADGGEGTLTTLLDAWGRPPIEVETVDALGRPTIGLVGISRDGAIGVVETAQSNGLPLVSDVPLQPLRAGSAGVGALVRTVLDAGVQEVLVCLGGSATSDGGTGMLSELGAQLRDSDGQVLPPGGAALRELATLDLSGLDPRARRVRWRVACDVTNPLSGPTGAAAVFGPQKGADPADVEVIDQGLRRLATVLHQVTSRDVGSAAGMGAAGGFPAVLTAVLDAELVPGGELVAQVLGAKPVLEAADLVITGEGRFDLQSLDGKVVDTVRRLTPPDTPVVVLAGEVALDPQTWLDRGITAAFSLAPGPRTLAELQTDVEAHLRAVATSVAHLTLS